MDYSMSFNDDCRDLNFCVDCLVILSSSPLRSIATFSRLCSDSCSFRLFCCCGSLL
jgi:hypothetical protein